MHLNHFFCCCIFKSQKELHRRWASLIHAENTNLLYLIENLFVIVCLGEKGDHRESSLGCLIPSGPLLGYCHSRKQPKSFFISFFFFSSLSFSLYPKGDWHFVCVRKKIKWLMHRPLIYSFIRSLCQIRLFKMLELDATFRTNSVGSPEALLQPFSLSRTCISFFN